MFTPGKIAIVVDDEFVVRRLTTRALTRAGFECHAAADADEARQLLATHPATLVVTDILMPGEHGYGLILNLLAQAVRPTLVVLTGVIEPRLEADLRRRGVDEVFHKPVDYSQFSSRIVELVAAHRTASYGGDSLPEPTLEDNAQPEQPFPTDDATPSPEVTQAPAVKGAPANRPVESPVASDSGEPPRRTTEPAAEAPAAIEPPATLEQVDRFPASAATEPHPAVELSPKKAPHDSIPPVAAQATPQVLSFRIAEGTSGYTNAVILGLAILMLVIQSLSLYQSSRAIAAMERITTKMIRR